MNRVTFSPVSDPCLDERHRQSRATSSSTPFIVIIDDSLAVRQMIEACLRREGYVVKAFAESIEALRWLILPDMPMPDLILLERDLPTMDGYGVARYLKSRPECAHTVIIMLSRFDGVIDRLKSRLAGAIAHVPKPLDMPALLAVITSSLIV